jgi:hypothetical protein
MTFDRFEAEIESLEARLGSRVRIVCWVLGHSRPDEVETVPQRYVRSLRLLLPAARTWVCLRCQRRIYEAV